MNEGGQKWMKMQHNSRGSFQNESLFWYLYAFVFEIRQNLVKSLPPWKEAWKEGASSVKRVPFRSVKQIAASKEHLERECRPGLEI